MTTLGSQDNILKEVYEKGKVKKLATSGRDEPFAETVGTAPSKKMPPFMKGRKVANVDDAKNAKADAAKRRLATMRKSAGK